MKTIRVFYTNEYKDLPPPSYASKGAAGVDLVSTIDVVLEPQSRALIPTGIRIELPDGYEAQIRPRSGLAIKHGITVLNSPGTIDSDYRGEIKIILINLGEESFEIKKGMRIAQMVIQPVVKAEFILKDNLSPTLRGEKGFGSSGI